MAASVSVRPAAPEPDSFEATLRVYEMTVALTRHQDQRRTMLVTAFAISNGLCAAVLMGGALSPASRAFFTLCAAGFLANLLWGALFALNDRELKRVEAMARLLQDDLQMEREWRLVPDTPPRMRMEYVIVALVGIACALWALPLIFPAR